MHYKDRDVQGIYKRHFAKHGETGPGPKVMGARTLLDTAVHNPKAEHLGTIEELMLDVRDGTIAYAVLSLHSAMDPSDKLYAIPWSALEFDHASKQLVLDVAKDQLLKAPGFDPDDWPDMADQAWAKDVNAYYDLYGNFPG